MNKEDITVGTRITNRAIEPKARKVVALSERGFDVVCVKKDGHPVKGAVSKTIPWCAAPIWREA